MSTTNFKNFGFSNTLTEANAAAFKKKFNSHASRRLKTGTYLGLTRLKEMVTSLEAGDYDGLQICYGITTKPAPGKAFGTYELMLTEVKLAGTAEVPTFVRKGILYASVADGSTEPPVLTCPPLKCDDNIG